MFPFDEAILFSKWIFGQFLLDLHAIWFTLSSRRDLLRHNVCEEQRCLVNCISLKSLFSNLLWIMYQFNVLCDMCVCVCVCVWMCVCVHLHACTLVSTLIQKESCNALSQFHYALINNLKRERYVLRIFKQHCSF